MSIDYTLMGVSILLLVSVLAALASERLGVPVLLLFLGLGMLAGSEGIGGIEFANAQLAQSIGTVALIFILFSGGMDTKWQEVRPVLPQGLVLATVGVLLTALTLGTFVKLITGITWLESILLGSIVSSTDAAAVFAIMRARGVGLEPRLRSLIELESGSNDPMAIFLTTAMIGLITGTTESLGGLVWMFVRQMIVGAALGYLLGRGMVNVIQRMQLEYEGLYPVLSIALVLFVYSVTAVLGGNGYLAIYIAGLVMGNRLLTQQRTLGRFHSGLAWLMQITMFLTLGLLVFPSQVVEVAGMGLLIAFFLMLVARPLAVVLALLPFRMGVRPTAMVGWVGLRGAVPIILATFPLLAGVEQSMWIFNVVFFIVLTSVLLQGSTIPWVARRLGVDVPISNRPRPPLEFESTNADQGELMELELPDHSSWHGKQLADLHLPSGVLLVMVGRDRGFFVPSGRTVLLAQDTLYLLSGAETRDQVKALFDQAQDRPKTESCPDT